MHKNAKIYVAGHEGLVGSAICRKLRDNGYDNLVARTRQELDLIDQQCVDDFFRQEKPDYVFLAAAKVGGIMANNTYRADFIYQNLQIQNNIIHQSYKAGVKKLLFLGSSCIYPRDCPQPMVEDHLLTGPLEATNEPYAVAKIAGIEMCWAYNQQYNTRFIPVMPTNLYGPNDNFDLETSHVLPALLRKCHEATLHKHKTVPIWGTGNPRREFLHVNDLADACMFFMNLDDHAIGYQNRPLFNIGTGEDIRIKDLACLMKEITGFPGELVFDPSKPDGTPKKLLDVSKIKRLGWQAKIDLQSGIRQVYDWFKESYNT